MRIRAVFQLHAGSFAELRRVLHVLIVALRELRGHDPKAELRLEHEDATDGVQDEP